MGALAQFVVALTQKVANGEPQSPLLAFWRFGGKNRGTEAASLSRIYRLLTKPPGGDFRRDTHRSKAVSSMMEVVSLAQQPEVRNVGCAGPCVRFDVVELEKRASIAAPTVCGNECTSTAVAIMNLSPYRRSQVTSALACRHCAKRRGFGHSDRHRNSTWWSVRLGGAQRDLFQLGPPRSRPDTEAPLLLLSNEARRHQLDQACETAVRQLVARERTRALN